MEDERPKWKTTKIEDDQLDNNQNGRQPKWKSTIIEDDQNGRQQNSVKFHTQHDSCGIFFLRITFSNKNEDVCKELALN